MYLEHFGLSEAPFRITPHTEFFFAGANRGATLDALIYSVVHNEGIVKVSGEVGSGKTMLCRVLMERLPEHVVVVYLANPSLSRDDIVYAVADELELEIPETTRTSTAIRFLQTRLIELHGDGRQVIALIDEAHAMPLETLEEVRLLSNLETSQHKLLQLVLFGQPELDEILARPNMRQLRERITQNFALEPLRRDDIAQYLDFRMRTAGYRGPEVFSPAAVRTIASASQGLTRRVNILAEKSLLAAFAEGTHLITPKNVDAAVRDSQYETGRWHWRKALVLLAIASAVGALAVVLFSFKPDSTAPSALSEPTRSSQQAVPAATASQLRVEAPTNAVFGVPEYPAPPPPLATNAGNETTPSNTLPSGATEGPSHLSAEAKQRLDDTRKWIDTTSGDRWFIQLITTNADQSGYAQQFLTKADNMLAPERVGLYVASTETSQRIGIIHGEFATRRAASEAIEKLPKDLRANMPFPRQLMWLK